MEANEGPMDSKVQKLDGNSICVLTCFNMFLWAVRPGLCICYMFVSAFCSLLFIGSGSYSRDGERVGRDELCAWRLFPPCSSCRDNLVETVHGTCFTEMGWLKGACKATFTNNFPNTV